MTYAAAGGAAPEWTFRRSIHQEPDIATFKGYAQAKNWLSVEPGIKVPILRQ